MHVPVNRVASAVVLAAAAVTCGDAAPRDASPASPGDASVDAPSAVDSASRDGPVDSSPAKDAPPPVLPDSGLPPEHAWLDDPEIWTLAPGTEFLQPNCYEFDGAREKLKFPPLTWADCGPGCAVMDMAQGFDKNGISAGLSVHRVSSATAVMLSASVGVLLPDWVYEARQVVDLTTGTAAGARMQRSNRSVSPKPCVMSSFTDAHAQGSLAAGNGVGALTMPATLDPGSGAWIRGEPPRLVSQVETGLAGFYLDGVGIRFFTGMGAVYAMLDPPKHDYTLLEGNSKSYLGDGDGDLAVWIDSQVAGQQSLKGWAPDGQGVRSIVTSVPPTTCQVSVSPSSIVGWFAAEGCSVYGSPRLFRLPRMYSNTGAAPELSPTLGTSIALGAIATWGNYAVASAVEPNGQDFTRYLLVVRLSDSKRWRIDPTSGFAPASYAWTLSDTHVYLGEGGTTVYDTHEIKHIRRLALDALDSLATPL